MCFRLYGWMAVIASLLGSCPAPAQANAVDLILQEKWPAIFEAAGAKGTMVVWDPDLNYFRTHNNSRSTKPYIPASTFKIPHTLIGLETGAVKSVDEVLPYGGQPQPIKAWEKDMSLRDAIKISNVPIYQELARRIGLEREKEWLHKLYYGNQQVGDQVDQFWLKGPLTLCAVEQVQFLDRLMKGRIRVDPKNVDAIREITLLEKQNGAALHGKTGWCTTTSPKVGWFVGWVEKDGKTYPFALNMDLDDAKLLPKRIEIAKACLTQAGIWPTATVETIAE